MQNEETRYHALDNLRAIMMWLGIVLHVAAAYITFPTHLPYREAPGSPLADLLMIGIHVFRMPVFFVIAGFLAALLLQRRGARGFALHRARRLGLPFVLFWPPLYVATGVAVLWFITRQRGIPFSMDPALLPANSPKGASTLHLWFVWMLLWFCLALALLSRLPRAPFEAAGRVLAAIGRRWWGFVPLAAPLLLASVPYPDAMLYPSGAFLPPWMEWAYNGVFFAFGLALHAHRDELLPHYERHWRRYAGAALGCFLLAGWLANHVGRGLLAVAPYCACAWLASFALLGAGLQKLGRRSAVLAYLADSAYWVYLVHLPLTVAFAALLVNAPLPAVVKMAIGIAGTTAICLASYALLVRHSWVGVLLNGRRHARAATKTVAA